MTSVPSTGQLERFEKGKRRFLNLLRKLEAEKQPVPLTELQKSYYMRYNRYLDKKELERFFGTGFFQTIMNEFFADSVEFIEMMGADQQSVYCLKLKNSVILAEDDSTKAGLQPLDQSIRVRQDSQSSAFSQIQPKQLQEEETASNSQQLQGGFGSSLRARSQNRGTGNSFTNNSGNECSHKPANDFRSSAFSQFQRKKLQEEEKVPQQLQGGFGSTLRHPVKPTLHQHVTNTCMKSSQNGGTDNSFTIKASNENSYILTGSIFDLYATNDGNTNVSFASLPEQESDIHHEETFGRSVESYTTETNELEREIEPTKQPSAAEDTSANAEPYDDEMKKFEENLCAKYMNKKKPSEENLESTALESDKLAENCVSLTALEVNATQKLVEKSVSIEIPQGNNISQSSFNVTLKSDEQQPLATAARNEVLACFRYSPTLDEDSMLGSIGAIRDILDFMRKELLDLRSKAEEETNVLVTNKLRAKDDELRQAHEKIALLETENVELKKIAAKFHKLRASLEMD